MNDRVHPVVRSIAANKNADKITANEYDDKIHHTVIWYMHGDEKGETKIPKYAFDRKGLSLGDPTVRVRDNGVIQIRLPVFAQKGMVPREFERLAVGNAHGGIPAWNWGSEDDRKETA